MEVAEDLTSISSAAQSLEGTIAEVVQLNSENAERCRNTVTNVETLVSVLGELKELTRRIDGFVAVINNVAKKTKLLALNATIEAARSGEYGRGFAVVASEVKALAGEAEGATAQVAQQAAAIQQAIGDAVRRVEGSHQLVKAIDDGVTTESRAIGQQSVAVGDISRSLAALTENARALRSRFEELAAA
jgi:methyl-accepting chemotaxis protein